MTKGVQVEKNETGGDAVVSCLKQLGVTKMFGVPGESFLPILNAIYGEPEMTFISNRHEGGASFMAEGYAKASNQPGVVLATRGVGASNLSIGVHTAMQDSTPLIVLLGQVHSSFLGREGFQEVDLEKYFNPISKWACEVRDAKRIPEIIYRAYKKAVSGRPGPVVLSFPEDVLRDVSEVPKLPCVEREKFTPCHDKLKQIEQYLKQANQPVVIAGGGIKHSQTEQRLEAFVERFDLPIVSAFRRHDVMNHEHPNFVGHLGLGNPKHIQDTIKKADTIIAIGTRLSEITTQSYSLISDEQTLIHIDISEESMAKGYVPKVSLQADAGAALDELLVMSFEPTWSEWRKERRQTYEVSAYQPVQSSDPINRHIIELLQDVLPEDAILTNDAGNFAGWLHQYYQFKRPNTYVGPTSGAMGYGVPAAIGAKVANPDRTVVALAGDGGFMMTMQEVETAVRNDIPIISIVFNNQMYGTIRMHQEKHYPKRVVGTDLGHVHFANLAESMGALGFQVQDISNFEHALSKALDQKRPTVIEVLTDPEQISVTSTIEDLRQS
ncbi:thiamine pyrophosphate-dependent enzyme [Aquisalibacillus elongatus]|uniref:Acetolactate synthase-1/2/3 large subunit n=1 Tax=Aquisalibacillus elongatus TaxID=485577 RepID=A0A3N5BXA1_9BACI|nr:thiamine pyrophosphate-dependent enzyme [Aquisalibacillus elongatus]RPF54398.1 acetolactate synthase-1/2/3 large subunit [Aquisalibacillus elongatus]